MGTDYEKFSAQFREVQVSLEHLMELGERIAQRGAVDRAVAEESVYSLGSNVVLESYQSGATESEKLRVSMEALSAGMWAAIVAGFGLLGHFIAKLIFGLKGGSSSSGGGGGGGGGATITITPKYVESVSHTVKELRTTVRNAQMSNIAVTSSFWLEFENRLSETERDYLAQGTVFNDTMMAIEFLTKGENLEHFFKSYWEEIESWYTVAIKEAFDIDGRGVEKRMRAEKDNEYSGKPDAPIPSWVMQNYDHDVDMFKMKIKGEILKLKGPNSDILFAARRYAENISNIQPSSKKLPSLTDVNKLLHCIEISTKQLEISNKLDSSNNEFLGNLTTVQKDIDSIIKGLEQLANGNERDYDKAKKAVHSLRLVAARDYVVDLAKIAKINHAVERYLKMVVRTNAKCFEFAAKMMDELAKKLTDPDEIEEYKEKAKTLREGKKQLDELIKNEAK